MKLKTTCDFYSGLFEKNQISNLIENATLLNSIDSIMPILERTAPKNSLVHALELVPSYLDISFTDSSIHKKTIQKQGFAVDLKGFNNVDDFIKSNCSSNFRKVFNRSLNRFEASFNISYKMFFGTIEKKPYDSIMNALEHMIANRFQQKSGRNKDLTNWQHHYKQTLKLINEKKASLFVIYSDDKPVEISLNYHIGSIMYSAISSYDLDYTKFSLGNVEIYKQLEWCLLNNITFFDMGYGDFDYKRRWSNFVYNFESHFISKNQTLLVGFYEVMAHYKYKTIDYLISKKINDKIYNLRDIFKKKLEEMPFIEHEITVLNNLSAEVFTETDGIDIHATENQWLRRPLYDFLYKQNEHIDDVNVFKTSNDTDSYVVVGKSSFGKIKL